MSKERQNGINWDQIRIKPKSFESNMNPTLHGFIPNSDSMETRDKREYELIKVGDELIIADRIFCRGVYTNIGLLILILHTMFDF